MTLNLQTVLAILGVLVVVMIYLISRWQNRMRRPSPSPKSARAESNPDTTNPTLNDFDTPPDEIPVLDPPVYSAQPFAAHDHADAVADDSDQDDATDFGQSENEEAIPEAQPNDDDIAADPDQAKSEHDNEEDPAEPQPTDDPTITPHPSPPEDPRTPVFTPPPAPANEPDPTAYQPRPVPGFERLSQIDYWVKITGDRDVGRETVLALYRAAAADLTKPHGLHGFKTPDQTWCNVETEAEDSRFTDLVLTIQLADRNGAISEREMTRFSALVSRLSEGTGREFVFMAPVENAFAQADAIAGFTRHFDAVFVVNIRSRGAERFHGPAIARCAPQMGLEQDDNHYYSRFKSIGKTRVALYSLADLSDSGRFDFDNLKSFSTRGLTFFTRPAVNRSPGAVFTEMVDTARAFASRIKGEVNSPNHGDLSQEEVEATRKSIEQVAAEMERFGIAAGSDEAARIF